MQRAAQRDRRARLREHLLVRRLRIAKKNRKSSRLNCVKKRVRLVCVCVCPGVTIARAHLFFAQRSLWDLRTRPQSGPFSGIKTGGEISRDTSPRPYARIPPSDAAARVPRVQVQSAEAEREAAIFETLVMLKTFSKF